MKERPLKGDWYHRVTLDFEKVDISMFEEVIIRTDLPTYTSLIKTAMWKVFFKELQEKKEMHIKVKHIQYSGHRLLQPYLTNPKFNNCMT